MLLTPQPKSTPTCGDNNVLEAFGDPQENERQLQHKYCRAIATNGNDALWACHDNEIVYIGIHLTFVLAFLSQTFMIVNVPFSFHSMLTVST